MNTDENPQVAIRYGIQGIPAVKGFRDGKMAAEFVGAVPEPQVRGFLQKLGVRVGTGATGPDPSALMAQGKWIEAEMALRRLGAANGAEPSMKLSLARALLAQGKAKEANEILTRDGSPEMAEAIALGRWPPVREATAVTDGAEIDGLYHSAGQRSRTEICGAMDSLLMHNDHGFVTAKHGR
jgi:thioredoxin-like negative regulator of GroEL